MDAMALYGDIIDLPHHVSEYHAQMPMAKRAAQFSMFKAVAGYEDEIHESNRLTDKRIELDEDAREILNAKLRLIKENMADQPTVSITYFLPDKKKEGGAYVTVTGIVDWFDCLRRRVVMQGGKMIPIDEILDIDGEIFEMLCC